MKKKLLFPCLLLIAVMLSTCVLAFGVGAAETMTMTEVNANAKTPAEGDIVTISTEAELKLFSAYVSNGGATAGITFRLEADIALKTDGQTLSPNTNFNPIGGVFNNANVKVPVAFKGIFDGNGKTVSNIYFTNKYRLATSPLAVKSNGNTANMGFFALLGEGAVVKNLTVSVARTKTVKGEYFGLLASKAEGATIIDCVVKSETEEKLTEITSSVAMGGLLGYAKDCVIDGCTASFFANPTSSVGAIVGVAENTEIRNCVTSGTYTHTKASILGGIAAELKGTSSVKNCYSSVVLESKLAGDVLGGVVGIVGADATVENCFSNVSVASGFSFVYGSLVGENNGTVKNAYALRDADLSSETGHADIGANNGAAENVYAYQPKTEDGKTVFVIGVVVCERDENKIDHYTFVPLEDNDDSLVDVLNDWATLNSTDSLKYQAWAVVGTTIVNCKHTSFVYHAYKGQEPTCVDAGHGDKHCAGCGVLIEENVEIPANPDAHATETGVVYPCLTYECIHCHTTIAAKKDHTIGTVYCQDQACTVCGFVVEATASHIRPDDFDETKPCMEYNCTACNEQVHEAEHDAPAVEYDCQTSECSVCGYTIPAKTLHRPGRAPTCTRSQDCLVCGEVVRKAKGHTWDEENPATCGAAQKCKECGVDNPDAPATGLHIYNISEPTCTDSMICLNCSHTPLDGRALGHSLRADQHVDCGHGKSCERCSMIVETATGDHDVDWSTAIVVREATPERTGIVVGVCAECGREVEAYTSSVAMEDAGNALVSGGSLTFYAGTKVNAVFGKVADYKNLTYAEGYLPLQVVTLSVVDAEGNQISVSGGVTVKVILNKSVSKMAAESIKLYQIVDGQATEVTISSLADGFATFTASSMGTFVLAGEKAAALNVLGKIPVQVQQTASLVGTAVYERRDFDI